MGWIDVDEERMAADILADTVNECITSLAEQRKDLWAISETWGEVCFLVNPFSMTLFNDITCSETSDFNTLNSKLFITYIMKSIVFTTTKIGSLYNVLY